MIRIALLAAIAFVAPAQAREECVVLENVFRQSVPVGGGSATEFTEVYMAQLRASGNRPRQVAISISLANLRDPASGTRTIPNQTVTMQVGYTVTQTATGAGSVSVAAVRGALRFRCV